MMATSRSARCGETRVVTRLVVPGQSTRRWFGRLLLVAAFFSSADAMTATRPLGKPLKVVVAGCLVDEEMRVLVAQRPAGKSFEGMWEFPGGKVELDETCEAALVRELAEELGIGVRAADLVPVSFSTVDELLMLLFACRTWTGAPTGLEGQSVQFVSVSSLRDGSLRMPPADVPLVDPVAKFVRDAFAPRWDRFTV